MAYLNFKKLIVTGTMTFFVMVTGSLLMAGCFGHGESSSDPLQDAHLKVKVGLVSADQSSPSSNPAIHAIVICLTSSSNDTILETITAKTSPALNPSGVKTKTLDMAYNLEPLRVWKVVAKAMDKQNHVLQVDSATTPLLKLSGSERVTLNLKES